MFACRQFLLGVFSVSRQRRFWMTLAAILLMLREGKAQEAREVSFCVADHLSSPPVIFDLKGLRVNGVDSIERMKIVDSGPYVGIVFPIPMMVPVSRFEAAKQSYLWQSAGYEFRAKSVPGEPDWLVVHATPISHSPDLAALSRTKTTILYSAQSGVLSYREVSVDFGRTYSTDYVLCGGGRLKLTELKNY